MKNKYFDIIFNSHTGGIISIQNPMDEYKMNWISAGNDWGLIRSEKPCIVFDKIEKYSGKLPELVSFCENDTTSMSVYSNDMIMVTVNRIFTDNGNFKETYTVKNLCNYDIFIGQDNFGITIPFNDCYSSAEECMSKRCHAHIWCGKSTSYVNALRMGESSINLGLVLTRGKLASYSVEGCTTNVRGVFVANSDFFALKPNEEYVIEWELFWHSGEEQFYKKALTYEQFIHIKAVNNTVFAGENIEFLAESGSAMGGAKIICNGKAVDYKLLENKISVVYTPKTTGVYTFEITVGDVTTYAEFLVSEPLDDVIEKRLNFIVDNQQCLDKHSSLYGAFLIYDTEEKHMVFEEFIYDHNACRERIGMAMLLAKYLQTHNSPKFEKALDLYIRFLKREFYDEETGEVYNSIGKKQTWKRLYNSVWVMMLFAEMYILTNDTYYTDNIVKAVKWFYENGGNDFYPNNLSYNTLMQVLYQSKNPEADDIYALFKKHADNILSIGTSYPAHEVVYEQCIVAPAVSLISDMGLLTNETVYKTEVKNHLVNLERFNGHQPSFHLNEIPIRYWDDFWFGKSKLFGDTFPHYWSCLTADSFMKYYKISNEEKYRVSANRCIRNCLCLFKDGIGSAAYVYPYMSNGKRGEFYDAFANDQDFALYFALSIYLHI